MKIEMFLFIKWRNQNLNYGMVSHFYFTFIQTSKLYKWLNKTWLWRNIPLSFEWKLPTRILHSIYDYHVFYNWLCQLKANFLIEGYRANKPYNVYNFIPPLPNKKTKYYLVTVKPGESRGNREQEWTCS